MRSEVAWALGETGTEKAYLALASAVEREANAETRAAADAALARIEQTMGKALVQESASAALLRMLGQVRRRAGPCSGWAWCWPWRCYSCRPFPHDSGRI